MFMLCPFSSPSSFLLSFFLFFSFFPSFSLSVYIYPCMYLFFFKCLGSLYNVDCTGKPIEANNSSCTMLFFRVFVAYSSYLIGKFDSSKWNQTEKFFCLNKLIPYCSPQNIPFLSKWSISPSYVVLCHCP